MIKRIKLFPKKKKRKKKREKKNKINNLIYITTKQINNVL